jgi:hypothetical protein
MSTDWTFITHFLYILLTKLLQPLEFGKGTVVNIGNTCTNQDTVHKQIIKYNTTWDTAI